MRLTIELTGAPLLARPSEERAMLNELLGAGPERKDMDMMKPSVSLLCKLGSIAVHADELLSPDGHQFDRVALEALMADAEVREWLAMMDSAAMLPKKRNAVPNDRVEGRDAASSRRVPSHDGLGSTGHEERK